MSRLAALPNTTVPYKLLFVNRVFSIQLESSKAGVWLIDQIDTSEIASRSTFCPSVEKNRQMRGRGIGSTNDLVCNITSQRVSLARVLTHGALCGAMYFSGGLIPSQEKKRNGKTSTTR